MLSNFFSRTSIGFISTLFGLMVIAPSAAPTELGSFELAAVETKSTSERTERICFFTDAVNSFNPIDEQHLLIRVSASKNYLLTLSHPCKNLRHTPQIVFGSRGGLVCNYSRSRISTGEDKCIIDDVEPVASYSEAQTLAKMHRSKLSENRRRR